MKSPNALYIQFTDPLYLPVLIRSGFILMKHNFKIHYLGVRFGDIPELRPSQAMATSITYAAVVSRRMPAWIAYARFSAVAIWRISRYRPSVLYLSDILSAPLGLLLSYLSSVPIVYHEHDAPDLRPQTIRGRALLWSRQHLLMRIAMCIAPNETRASRLSPRGVTTVCHPNIYNTPLRSEVLPPRRDTDGSRVPIRLYYHGSINASRVPLSIIDALAGMPEAELTIAGYESRPGYLTVLEKRAESLGVGHQVKFLGTIASHDELMTHAGRATIGLSLMPMDSDDFNERSMAGASQKAFEYLACGLPIIVTDRREWVDFYVSEGVAAACDPSNPQSIRQAVETIAANSSEYRKMSQRGQELVERIWNYELSFAPVLRELKDIANFE